jgi:hypothetical protein
MEILGRRTRTATFDNKVGRRWDACLAGSGRALSGVMQSPQSWKGGEVYIQSRMYVATPLLPTSCQQGGTNACAALVDNSSVAEFAVDHGPAPAWGFYLGRALP